MVSLPTQSATHPALTRLAGTNPPLATPNNTTKYRQPPPIHLDFFSLLQLKLRDGELSVAHDHIKSLVEHVDRSPTQCIPDALNLLEHDFSPAAYDRELCSTATGSSRAIIGLSSTANAQQQLQTQTLIPPSHGTVSAPLVAVELPSMEMLHELESLKSKNARLHARIAMMQKNSRQNW